MLKSWYIPPTMPMIAAVRNAGIPLQKSRGIAFNGKASVIWAFRTLVPDQMLDTRRKIVGTVAITPHRCIIGPSIFEAVQILAPASLADITRV